MYLWDTGYWRMWLSSGTQCYVVWQTGTDSSEEPSDSMQRTESQANWVNGTGASVGQKLVSSPCHSGNFSASAVSLTVSSNTCRRQHMAVHVKPHTLQQGNPTSTHRRATQFVKYRPQGPMCVSIQGYSLVPSGFPNSTAQQPRQTRQKGAYQ